MNRVALLAGLALLGAGCGRWRFDELFDGDGGTSDVAETDGQASCGHTFCDDFNRAGPPELGWDTVDNTGEVAFSLETTDVISPPAKLRVHLPGTSLQIGNFHKQLPMATTSVTVTLQLAISTSNINDAEIDLLALHWDSLPTGCDSFGYNIVRDGTMQFNLQETYVGPSCGGSEQNYRPLLDNTGWHEVKMTVLFGDVGTARIQMTVDSNVLVDHTTSHAILPSTLTLGLGAAASRNIVAPWDFDYDDLVVDVN